MLPFSDCFKESHEIENDEHTMSYQIHKEIEKLEYFWGTFSLLSIDKMQKRCIIINVT